MRMKMSKGSLIAIAAAFILSVGVTFAIIKLKTPASKPSGSPLASLSGPAPSIPAASEKLYRDEAGFSFKYPSDLTVTDDTPDDDVHYSRLKLKSGGGTMIELVVKDTSEQPQSAPNAVDLKFGNMPAKQFRANGRLVTAAVNDKILYQLISPDSEYWQKIHNQIAASFVEGVISAESAVGQSDIIYEPEEIVE